MQHVRSQQVTRKAKDGLQVQRLTLTARGKPIFTLFPMIHVADKTFFDRIMAEADSHDCVLKEGVDWRPVARTTQNAYRNISRGSPALAVQPSGPDIPRAKWYNTDLDRDDFRQKWKKIPLFRRLFFHIALRIAGLFLRFGKVRALLADALASSTVHDSKTLEGVFGKEFRQVVMDDRDAALLRGCETVIDRRPDDRVAVVWGAAHLPPLVRALSEKHGYRISKREWITAIATD